MPAQITLSRDEIRRLAVVKQGLHRRPPASDPDALKRIIDRIGLLQLDSISVVARSHYLVMLSRAGVYDPAHLDALLDSGFLFETWAHAMCQVPFSQYAWYHNWIRQRHKLETRWKLERLGDDFAAVVERVCDTIRERGPMSSKDFEQARRGQAGWWNWKPAKLALEYLLYRGRLMVSHRVNFQRHYDLSERVLAGRQFRADLSIDDYYRWAAESGLRHLGAATGNQVADYYRIHKRRAAAILADMQRAGEILPVAIAGIDGDAFIHRDDLPLLQSIRAGEHAPGLTVFLSPFDNLFWDRDRDAMLWDFHYRIEVYTPKAKRVYGYYVMPILHGSQLVGRVDPKVDRKRKRLIFNALYLEKGAKQTAELSRGLIDAIEEFMAFHGCDSFELVDCAHRRLAGRLRRYFS